MRRDNNFGTRIDRPETSVAVFGEIGGELRSEPALLFNVKETSVRSVRSFWSWSYEVI